uniref:Phenylalanyl-tRNA synthetase domain-containing protein n=1 Tax=Ditylenchus dipsaci TaxID=166011 RepID=A0A915DBX6_9BILA
MVHGYSAEHHSSFERRLFNEPGNPLNLLKQRIINYFYTSHRKPNSGSPLFRSEAIRHLLCEQRLLFAFAYNSSSIQVADARSGHFIMYGDVFRRDDIDRTHFPCFHQLDCVRTYSSVELFGSQQYERDEPLMFEENPCKELRTLEKQEYHSLDAARVLVINLKSSLEGLCRAIFGPDVQTRWWLEVLGCGVMDQKLLESAGAGSKVGWAFDWVGAISHDFQFASLTPDDSIAFKPLCCGCLPLFFNLSEKKIRLASIFGAGLLVGTALCVIIPEGISTLYESSVPALTEHFHSPLLNNQKIQPDSNKIVVEKKPGGQPLSNSQEKVVDGKPAESSNERKHQQSSTHFEMPNFNGPYRRSNQRCSTLGLVIHAAADGIAMGSASTSTEARCRSLFFWPSCFIRVPQLLHCSSYRDYFHLHIVTHDRNNIFVLSICDWPYTSLSAGTFLYIAAAHILPELVETKCSLSSGQGRAHFSIPEVLLFCSLQFVISNFFSRCMLLRMGFY